MNILFVSHLTNNISEGPNYSVPAQVLSQSCYDNVFWWNLTKAKQSFWLEKGLFHNIDEFPNVKISVLPVPFNNPDLVVFEGFYFINNVKLAIECRKKEIPYIIIPRCSLTWQAQKKKRLKKIVGNWLIFNKFAKQALAIQYLTQSEQNDSGQKWNEKSVVIPNGIYPTNFKKDIKKKNNIRGIYIGRFDIYHKGLDLLLEACKESKDKLIKFNIKIYLYGPDYKNAKKKLLNKINLFKLQETLFLCNAVSGSEKKNIIENADFFIMTSRFEGLPMSLIEALSYHLPCLVTQGTYMANDILKSKAGWACETSVEGIKQAFSALINDLDNLDDLSNNAYSLSQKYDWQNIAKTTNLTYSLLVAGRNREV